MEAILAKGVRPGGRGETLHEHTERALRVLKSLQERHPELADQVGESRLWDWAERSLLLHDMGKGARPFQDYLRGKAGPWGHRHEVLSLAFLPLVVEPGSEEFAWVAAAVASHHRDAPYILSERYSPRGDPEDMDLPGLVASMDEQTYLVLAGWVVERAGRGCYPVKPSLSPSVQDGAESVLKGLRAYRRLQRNIGDRWPVAVALRGLVTQADHVASAGHEKVVTVRLPDPDGLACALGARSSSGRPLKWHAFQLRLASAKGSVVASAPTGSGKTEAALLWAHHQQHDHGGGLLIYILPYQASANAMAGRLRSTLGTEVALLHGRSAEAAYRDAVVAGEPNPTLAALRMQDVARLRQPGVWVTTIYQLLRAAYQLPGWESLWTSLSSAMLVLDEAHAYEPDRTGMMLGFLREAQSRWGSRVCALTATAPTWLKDLLEKGLAAKPVAADEATYATMRRHRLEMRPGDLLDAENLAAIADEAARGTAVLVTVNTVRRAQEVWELLRRLVDGEVVLLHSLFAPRDRLEKENRVAEARGAELQVGALRPLVLVATQVVEVSLNLDFDCLYTDPAPLEALIQRFGRVNRKGRLDLAPVRVFYQPDDGQGVYDRELVRRGLSVLTKADGLPIEEEKVGRWLDDAYGDDLSALFTKRVLDSADRFTEACLRHVEPFQSNQELAHQFDHLFNGTEVLPEVLTQAYAEATQTSVLEASSLLVPLSEQKLAGLKSMGLARFDRTLRHWVVSLPYDCEQGLAMPAVRTEEEGGE